MNNLLNPSKKSDTHIMQKMMLKGPKVTSQYYHKLFIIKLICFDVAQNHSRQKLMKF
jgi:hypothetical protein